MDLNGPYRIEMDTEPSVYSAPSEYTGFLLTRQLHRPLFRARESGIAADLLTAPERLEEKQWRFRVADDAVWKDGTRIEADDVARGIHQATSVPRFGWSRSLFSRVEASSLSELIITTRFPVVGLDRVLAMPAFAPQNRERPSGKFRIEQVGKRRMRLRASDPKTTRDVDLVTTESREAGHRLYRTGALDLGWGVGVPTTFWEATDPGPFQPPVELDMHFVVTAGRLVGAPASEEILRMCRLTTASRLGVLPTDTRLSTRFYTRLGSEGRSRDGRKWPLYYSAFPPNPAVAAELAVNAGGRIVPTVIDYNALFGASNPQDGFSLSIHVAAFPGLLGNLPETAAMLRPSDGVSDELAESARRHWSHETDHSSDQELLQFERSVDVALRRRVVGKLRSRFRGIKSFDLPPTGIFDFAELAKRNERQAYVG